MIARRIEEIAETNLPVKGQIEHPGWQIITLAHAYRIRRAKNEEWESLIERANALTNVADQAFVLHNIGLCLPNSMRAERATLFQRAKETVAEIPSITDKIDRYVGFAEDMEDVDTASCRTLLAAACEVLPKHLDKFSDEYHHLVDVAFRVDDAFASALIDRLDDDEAKKAAQAQLQLLKVRREVFDQVTSSKAVQQIGPKDMSKVGWMLVRALGRVVYRRCIRVTFVIILTPLRRNHFVEPTRQWFGTSKMRLIGFRSLSTLLYSSGRCSTRVLWAHSWQAR